MVPIFCYARGTILLFLTVLAHANLVSSDYPMFSHNCDLPLEFHGHATIEDYDYVFRLTGYPAGDPDKASYVGQVKNPRLIKFYYRSINHVYDLTTMFSNYSIFEDDFVFVIASSDFLYGNQEDGLGIILVSKYISEKNNLNVSATRYRLSEGQEPHNFSQTNLRGHLSEYVGISASAGKVDEKKRNLIKIKLWEGLAVGCLCLSLGLLAMLIYFLWKKNKGKEEEPNSETVSDQNMDEEFQMGAGPKKICYQELLNATNNFEEKLKLGQGGFGGVYKGYFKDTNSVAAIKRISANSRQGIKQYSAEVKIISQLRHRNLVKLNGWCHKKNEFILIYEYMPNGSLDFHLFLGGSILSWHLRYNIALGLASALFYLQEELEKCVIHRDIKSSNIMLDSNFNTKLG
ncbi:L-type lectin-domain containing receptor kinase IX.1-like protein, partial [Trifolium pratense]